jgi:adenylate cyclase
VAASQPPAGAAGHVPARVAAEIRAREASAERLIGWIQLALVVFFAAL